MERPVLYPLRFEPILRQLIWGGRRLGTVLHKPIGAASDYAESWEVSDYHDQVSVVSEGPLAGTTLRELIERRPLELLGSAIGPREQFPLLVKFIDANQDLSVQVHPDDTKGKRLADDNGKTETWVILDAEPRQPDLCRLAGGRRPGGIPPRHRRGTGRAAPAPIRGPTRRFGPDRGGDGARHRSGRPPGRDPADVGCHVSRLRLEPRRPRRQAAATPRRTGDGVDRLPSRPGQPDHAPARADRRGRDARTAGAVGLLRARTTDDPPADRRRPRRSIHDPDGPARAEPRSSTEDARSRWSSGRPLSCPRPWANAGSSRRARRSC